MIIAKGWINGLKWEVFVVGVVVGIWCIWRGSSCGMHVGYSHGGFYIY